MSHQPQDETKQPPPPPSTETSIALTTTSNAYLSTHLIVPYFINAQGEIKRPEHLIAWWSRIFSFYVPDDKDHIKLRTLCRLFRDALKPPPLWTTFPHPNYPTLNLLMDALNSAYEKAPTYTPKIVFIMKGTFHIPVTKDEDGDDQNYVTIGYPIIMIGAGQDTTTIHGGFKIEGMKEEEKEVSLQDMTMMGSSWNGLSTCNNSNGLSILCDSMTFTQCGLFGVYVNNTKGRLINCVITKCGASGIYCSQNVLVELKGSQTKVDGNVTSGNSYHQGLQTSSKSRIHLLFPLTKESVSTNNHSGRNYGGCGEIAIVDGDGAVIKIINEVKEDKY
jgi:hypothetical protein